MFDVAPSELLIVAIVALVVIGPKDLPKAMRYVGQWVAKGRAMARHFRSGIDTMIRDAELEEMEQKWRAHNEAIMQAHPNIVANSAVNSDANGAVGSGMDSAPVMMPITPPRADGSADPLSDPVAGTIPPQNPPQYPPHYPPQGPT